MPLKEKRTVIIKNPHLRRVRNNLRSLVIQACGDEQGQLQGEREKLKLIPDYYKSHPPELLKEVRKLSQQVQENRRQLYASIIVCPACFQSDKDMTYNPVRKEWYCTGCYAELKKGFTEEGQPEQFP